jgi:hypothetical protein
MTNSTTFSGSLSCTTSTVSNAMTLGTTKTFVVTMTNASGGNKYYIDGYLQASLELHQGQTYIFDLSSGTLSGHPFIFSESNSNDGTTNGTPYTTGITTTGTYASSEKRTFIVPVGAPTTLYYYCTAHSGMGASASISPTAKLIVSGRVDSTDLVVTGTEGMTISVGTTAQRPSNPTTGMIRYNSTIGFMESYLGTGWAPIAQPPTVASVSPTSTLTSGAVSVGWDAGAKFVASDPQLSSTPQLGWSVSMSADGNKFIAGARNADHSVTDGGAAYIFTYNGTSWDTGVKIVASDAQTSDYFGYSVSMSSDGTKVAVGAYYEDAGGAEAGAAYVFIYNGTAWVQQAKLVASDPGGGDYFGNAVSMSGDGTKVIAGAWGEYAGGTGHSGSAYIFTKQAAASGGAWVQEAKIFASDKQASDYFGYSVSMNSNGTKVAVGAYAVDTVSPSYYNHGCVYIYTYDGSTWGSEQILQASDKQTNDYLGWSVSMSGDGNKFIVGAKGEDTGGADAGAAYIFTYSSGSWDTGAKLVASDPGANDLFGYHVAMSSDGTKVLVGAPQQTTVITNAGAAYQFVYNSSSSSWVQERKIQGTDLQTGDLFGWSVAMSSDGNKLLVGAINEGAGGNLAGAAYKYEYTPNQIFDSSTQVFTATGSGIIPGSTVQLEGADGTLYSVFNTTPNAAGTQVTFKMGALGATGGYAVAQQPYKIRVNAKSGLSGTSTTPLIGFAVGWTSPAAGANLDFDTTASTTQTLAGTDGAGGTNRTFSVAPSSTALPGGLTLTGSTGVITGTIGAVGTTSVTFRLTDNGSGQFTDRAINIVGSPGLFTFSSHTFTNAGVTGRSGPALATLTGHADYSAAAWRTNTAYFNTGNTSFTGFQLWTVPETATYRIKVAGARGASGNGPSGYTAGPAGGANNGGLGAYVQADFAFTKGVKINMIVGQSGGQDNSHVGAGGGAGASWVMSENLTTTLYAVGGGGGGGNPSNYNSANYGTNGGTSQGASTTNGGVYNRYAAGGGAGWVNDGGNTSTHWAMPSAGHTPGNGAYGGLYGHSSYQLTVGGFGGGGGGGAHQAGGGAGYAGGAVTDYMVSPGAYGGTSYASSSTNRSFATHTGLHGFITITKL